ncbi:hypothetical protein IMY05_C2024000800 [Salix suchowensis]|nr:hypothetical protein IMY05_C2024000800 [Salix suchowensis]
MGSSFSGILACCFIVNKSRKDEGVDADSCLMTACRFTRPPVLVIYCLVIQFQSSCGIADPA